MLGDFLRGLVTRRSDLAFAILRPESSAPPRWRALWASREGIPDGFDGALSPVPAEVAWMGTRGALGMSLASRLEPLGLLAWPLSAETASQSVLEALERCREIYWEESERKWMQLINGLLTALREQRREVGSAIHRGPAQALTAARIELSMMGQSTQHGRVALAIEQASESLVQLVHGKLRGRRGEPGLAGTLRAELDFQARWHDLPPQSETVTLPEGAFSGTLAELWRLTGGEVRRQNGTATFILGATP